MEAELHIPVIDSDIWLQYAAIKHHYTCSFLTFLGTQCDFVKKIQYNTENTESRTTNPSENPIKVFNLVKKEDNTINLYPANNDNPSTGLKTIEHENTSLCSISVSSSINQDSGNSNDSSGEMYRNTSITVTSGDKCSTPVPLVVIDKELVHPSRDLPVVSNPLHSLNQQSTTSSELSGFPKEQDSKEAIPGPVELTNGGGLQSQFDFINIQPVDGDAIVLPKQKSSRTQNTRPHYDRVDKNKSVNLKGRKQVTVIPNLPLRAKSKILSLQYDNTGVYPHGGSLNQPDEKLLPQDGSDAVSSGNLSARKAENYPDTPAKKRKFYFSQVYMHADNSWTKPSRKDIRMVCSFY